MTTNWYADCPRMFLHMTLLMKLPFLPTGVFFIKSLVGGSVASASAPRVSIIMFTHKSWTAVRGVLPESVKSNKIIVYWGIFIQLYGLFPIKFIYFLK